MTCGWKPVAASPNCDWDRNCPDHGEAMTEDNLPLVPGIAPAPHKDPDWVAKHNDPNDYWRQRFEAEANVRWDDGCPPGGMVCATCGEPVESEPCPEHNPKAIVASRRWKFLFGRTEGLEVTQLADMLREDATALSAQGAERIAATDDPLTLVRCLYETVAALAEITPVALTAARLNPESITTEEGPDVADIYENIAQGLARAHNALRDATDCI